MVTVRSKRRVGRVIDRRAGTSSYPAPMDATTDFDPTAPLPGAPDPWASTEMPSHRDGPPFHMTEMIAAEPSLAARILAGAGRAPQRRRGRGDRGPPSHPQRHAGHRDRVRYVGARGLGRGGDRARSGPVIRCPRTRPLRAPRGDRGPGVRAVPGSAVERTGHRDLARGRDDRHERRADRGPRRPAPGPPS